MHDDKTSSSSQNVMQNNIFFLNKSVPYIPGLASVTIPGRLKYYARVRVINIYQREIYQGCHRLRKCNRLLSGCFYCEVTNNFSGSFSSSCSASSSPSASEARLMRTCSSSDAGKDCYTLVMLSKFS